MTLESNFINHSKEYIFLEDDVLCKQREKTYNKILQKDYDKKNNESLKSITISDISNFNYFNKPIKEDSTVLLIDDLNYEIKLVNGICKNYEDDTYRLEKKLID